MYNQHCVLDEPAEIHISFGHQPIMKVWRWSLKRQGYAYINGNVANPRAEPSLIGLFFFQTGSRTTAVHSMIPMSEFWTSIAPVPPCMATYEWLQRAGTEITCPWTVLWESSLQKVTYLPSGSVEWRSTLRVTSVAVTTWMWSGTRVPVRNSGSFV